MTTEQTTSTALTLPQRAAVALGAVEHEKKLILLVEESKTIKEIKNGDAREQCHTAYMKLKNTRVNIQKVGKDARDDATKFSKAVIVEENRLVAIVDAEETRLQSLRDKWDADREAEKQAKIAEERKRVEIIRLAIDGISRVALSAVGMDSVAITLLIAGLKENPISEEFAEFAEEARGAKEASLSKLEQLLVVAVEREAEAARLIAEREELARLRQEAEVRKAEDERKAAEARAAQEAELAEARRKQETELATQRAEIARQQAERDAEAARQAQAAKEAQEAAQAKLDADRAELDRRRAEIEAERRRQEEVEAERIAAIAEAEAEEAERVRLQAAAEQMLIDAREPETEPVAQVVWPFPTGAAERQAILAAKQAPARPKDQEIIEVLALHFRAHESKVIEWLLDMDLEAASREMVATI